MARLDTIVGITSKQAERLRDAGVSTTQALLRQGSTPDGRRELAKATRIDSQRLANWVHRADLVRVKGVTDDHARLLIRAGVDSVVELSTQNPIDLRAELVIAEAMEQTGRRLPTHQALQGWIEQARLLLRNVWYHDTWGDEARTGRPPARYQGPRY